MLRNHPVDVLPKTPGITKNNQNILQRTTKNLLKQQEEFHVLSSPCVCSPKNTRNYQKQPKYSSKNYQNNKRNLMLCNHPVYVLPKIPEITKNNQNILVITPKNNQINKRDVILCNHQLYVLLKMCSPSGVFFFFRR